MSPQPIIARQRALSRVGEVRIGGERPARGAGKKLEHFRLTSQQRDIIDRCAELYGGKVTPWQSPAGDAWQLYTDAEALPCMVVVGYSLRQTYELWEGASKRLRQCDGIEEEFSGGPCICNTEGEDKCKTITRLMVVLPATGTLLGWQVRSQGENAARELAGSMAIVEQVAQGRAFVAATLRLMPRRSTINGQVVKYAVPVLDIDPAEMGARPSALDPGAAPLAIEAGEATTYTPLAVPDGPSPSEALDATKRARKSPRPSRAEPIGQHAPMPEPSALKPVLDGEDTAPHGGAAGKGEPSSPSSTGRGRREGAGQRTKEQDDADGVDVFGAPLDETSQFKPPDGATVRKITDGQRRFLFARAKKELGLSEDQIRGAIEEVTGQRSTAEIPADQFDAVLALCELKGQEGQ